MNRLVIQEIEKFLSRSIVYVQQENADIIELVAKDLVTGKEMVFTKKEGYSLITNRRTTNYFIAENDTIFPKQHFFFSDAQTKQIFDAAHNRYQEYFKGFYSDAEKKFYQRLLKNNHRVK